MTSVKRSIESDKQAGGVPKASGLKGWLVLLGPAIIVGAMQFGPGNYVSATALGAETGYAALWVFAISAVLMFAFVDMGVRIGMALPSGPLQAVRGIFGRRVGTVLVGVIAVAFFVVEVLFLTGTLVGGAMGLHALFGGTIAIWTVVLAIAGLAVFLLPGAYKRLEFAMILAMGVLVVVFFIVLVLVAPGAVEIAQGFIPSSIPGGSLTVFAVLGTNLSMVAAFYAIYTTREKGMPRKLYKRTTLVDTVPGVFVPAAITMVMIIVAAAVIPNTTVESATDFVAILEVVASPTVAVWLFGIGIVAASFSSVLGNAGVTASAVSDSLNQGGFLRGSGAKITIAAVLSVSAIVVIVFGGAPVALVLLANSTVLFFFPFLAIAMLILANSRRLMGDLKNGWIRNLLCGVGLLVILYGSVQVGAELFL